jgi:hypothetical protein
MKKVTKSFRSGDKIYGTDTFEDCSVIPWIRYLSTKGPKQTYRWATPEDKYLKPFWMMSNEG